MEVATSDVKHFVLLVLNFFSSSHDLLEIARLVLDQFNPFLESLQYADVESNGSGEKEQTPGLLQHFIGKSNLKKGSIFLPT